MRRNIKSKNFFILAAAGVIFFAAVVFLYTDFFGALKRGAEAERFIIPLNLDEPAIVSKLKEEGFIRRAFAFNLALSLEGGHGKIKAGGYQISKSMNVWQVARTLIGESYMKWVVIPEGLRKEEIADILAEKLDWSEEVKEKWINVDTAKESDYTEGVYFPDTYLISKDEEPEKVAKRLQVKFQEKINPFSKEVLKQNIKWTTLVKIASIVQREAAGKNDMPLVAGIIWNRLEKELKLEVDATVQYARGKTEEGWWAPIKVADKKINSPYNTYLNKGLPLRPIDNPGLDAIKAVLYPEKTACLYYIHDNSRVIHCAKTYEEHLGNIEEYLR